MLTPCSPHAHEPQHAGLLCYRRDPLLGSPFGVLELELLVRA